MAIHVDPDLIRSIAASCRKSADAIEGEAQTMQSQVQQLQQAVSGIPGHVGLEDRFAEWNRLFTQLSNALHESDSFLNAMAQRIDQLVADFTH